MQTVLHLEKRGGVWAEGEGRGEEKRGKRCRLLIKHDTNSFVPSYKLTSVVEEKHPGWV